ncbi:N5-glutamine methyltransferase family protein [Maribacter halichondriae]|uniref:N5-glutamine methyltransferase family protein n=1 Tax=Maribacter halichondriae TaxID=2980554 RepID=UPI00307618CA
MLLREIKNIFHKELDGKYASEEIANFFYMLIEHYMGLERFVLALRPDLIISKEEETPFFAALSELRLNRPIQYVLGKTTFMDLELYVDENVLIPRPETEELVGWILHECQAEPIEALKKNVSEIEQSRSRKTGLKILDIGTGSGCIAISLAKNLPGAKVYALDVSDDALQVAQRNAELNKVEINFINSDILGEDVVDDTFDIIVSNPPYVRELEKKKWQRMCWNMNLNWHCLSLMKIHYNSIEVLFNLRGKI